MPAMRKNEVCFALISLAVCLGLFYVQGTDAQPIDGSESELENFRHYLSSSGNNFKVPMVRRSVEDPSQDFKSVVLRNGKSKQLLMRLFKRGGNFGIGGQTGLGGFSRGLRGDPWLQDWMFHYGGYNSAGEQI